MSYTYPNDWVCPHRPMSTFLWQPTFLTSIPKRASLSRWLLHPLLPPTFFITHHCATIDTLVAGRFCRQSSTTSLRWFQHQPLPVLCCSNSWFVVVLLSAAAAHFCHGMPSYNRRCSCCQPLSPPIVNPCPQVTCHQPPPAFAASVIGWLFCCCLPPTFGIACCGMTVNSPVAGRF